MNVSSSPVVLKFQELSTRVKTAIVGGTAFLVVLLFGGFIGATMLAALIAGLICWELSAVFYQLHDKHEKSLALVGLSWLIIFANLLFTRSQTECLILAQIGLFTYYLATAERHPQQLKQHFIELVSSIFALLYVVTFVSFLPLIRGSVNGWRWALIFFIIVWATDTGAYFIGKKYGKNKLYPLISPGKTVEGAIGGVLSGVIAALLFKFIAFRAVSIPAATVTSVLIAVLSQVGDLCESFLKRAYGLKDTGQVLPGHGGALDRFDGVLFALPLMYFCMRIFG